MLPTTAPLSYFTLTDLSALLEASGHGDLVTLETWSRDAGTYYCNDQFYSTLNAVRLGSDAGSSLIPVGGSSDRAADVNDQHKPQHHSASVCNDETN